MLPLGGREGRGWKEPCQSFFMCGLLLAQKLQTAFLYKQELPILLCNCSLLGPGLRGLSEHLGRFHFPGHGLDLVILLVCECWGGAAVV